jgi:YegS/Rv2252/BmrU family lipid kinase
MERKIVFVINPAAGKRDRSKEIEKLIHKCMEGENTQYVLYRTKAPGDGENFVRNFAQADTGSEILFVACGGDGTLNEVLNGAIGFKNVSVTHYPCGSGNDFIKSLRINIEKFTDIKALVSGKTEEIDVIECGGRYSLNICSIGLDARIAADVPKLKRLPFVSGSGAYILSMISNFFKKISEKYRIKVNDEVYDGYYVIVVAANGTHYGGGFNPIPEASPKDGVLDFLLVKKLSRFVIAKVVNKYKQGRYREIMKYFTCLSGKTLELFAEKPVIINVDGEIIEKKDVKISLSEKRIPFCFPAGALNTQ